jgi:hypothetical protein
VYLLVFTSEPPHGDRFGVPQVADRRDAYEDFVKKQLDALRLGKNDRIRQLGGFEKV